MRKTEKCYWVNGHQVRGGHFHTFTANIGRIAIMISWSFKKYWLDIELYKLT